MWTPVCVFVISGMPQKGFALNADVFCVLSSDSAHVESGAGDTGEDALCWMLLAESESPPILQLFKHVFLPPERHCT